MASIYDTNFQDLYQKYRNKQRLAGGQIDPGVVGSLAEADLNARYADQKSRRAQDLQQQSINNSYDIANRTLTQNSALANKQLSAQKSSDNISNLASILPYVGSLYRTGQEAGLWGAKQPTAQEQAQTNLYNAMADRLAGGRNQNYTAVPNGYFDAGADAATSGLSDMLFNGDYYNYTPVDTGMPSMLSELIPADSMQYTPVDTSWMDSLMDFIF